MAITDKQGLFNKNLKDVLGTFLKAEDIADFLKAEDIADFLKAEDIADLEVDSLLINTSVMEDLRFPVNVLRIPSVSKIPERVAFGLAFDKATEEECYCVAQMPHSRDRTTDLLAHFHWQTKDNGAGNVVWGVKWENASINGAFTVSDEDTTISASVTDSTKHIMSGEITIPATTLGISGISKLTIFRDATNELDTYDNDAILMEFDLHYYVDKFGENV